MRDLRGVLDRERAEMGVLISLDEPTGPMRTEAASAGFYESPAQPGKLHSRLQLLTVAELLDGKAIDLPPVRHETTFKLAPKAVKKKKHQSRTLSFEQED